MRIKLAALMLLAGSALFAGPHVFVGVGVGGPGYYAPAPVVGYAPPPPAPAYLAPPAPGVGYSWVGGYWYPNGGRYLWHGGYWARPPYAGAYWVGPRYYGHSYYPGYWGRGYHRR